MPDIGHGPISDYELDQLIKREEKFYTGKQMNNWSLSALYELRKRRESDYAKITITEKGMRMLEDLSRGEIKNV